MSGVTRFGVSLEQDLLLAFDEICHERGYESRSEAIRDLIRATLADERWAKGGASCGALTLIYDHHKHDLARRIMNIQHEAHDLVVATLHVHLDHENCLETLVLKGEAARVESVARNLVSCRGVKYGIFNPAPTGKDLP